MRSILYNIEDKLPLDEIVYLNELHCNRLWIPASNIRIICDPKPWDLPRTLSHRLKNARKVDRLNRYHDGIFHTSMYSVNDIISNKLSYLAILTRITVSLVFVMLMLNQVIDEDARLCVVDVC